MDLLDAIETQQPQKRTILLRSLKLVNHLVMYSQRWSKRYSHLEMLECVAKIMLNTTFKTTMIWFDWVLTCTAECDCFPAHRFNLWYFCCPFDILHAYWSLQLQEMIFQNGFGKFRYAEWIKAPVNWMPSLKCAVQRYQNCVGLVCMKKGKLIMIFKW